jgi:hypothetical protein
MKFRCFSLKFLATIGLLAAVSVLHPGTLAAQDHSDKDSSELKATHEPPLMGIHWAREFARPAHRNSSPDMLWHNGAILNSSYIVPIFWGTSWNSSDPKVPGLQSFYTGFSNSNYAKTSDEYTGTDGQVGPSDTFGGYHIDTSAASGGSRTSTILAEVCKVIGNTAVSDGYYPVYTDVPRGHAGYCAWHSYGTCGTTPVQFAFFFDLDGDPGCDPQDTQTGHPQGLAALANVSAHELSETRTDPRSGGWYDSSGSENGDKCAWTFNVPYVTFTDGSIWKVQGEWSNAAYNAGTGYPNSSGQHGCLDGK